MRREEMWRDRWALISGDFCWEMLISYRKNVDFLSKHVDLLSKMSISYRKHADFLLNKCRLFNDNISPGSGVNDWDLWVKMMDFVLKRGILYQKRGIVYQKRKTLHWKWWILQCVTHTYSRLRSTICRKMRCGRLERASCRNRNSFSAQRTKSVSV